MDRPVVVPLDGSALAEEALPFARGVAARLGAPLHLVRVHAPATKLLARVSDGHTVAAYEDRRLRAAAARYLEEARVPLEEGMGPDRVEAALLAGPVGEALVSYARARHARLLVMTTDERGALGRRLFGSVTDHVLRWAGIPVLLTGASGRRGTPAGAPGFDRILVPLDGAGPGAEVLEHAIALGGAERARYVLTRTVPPGVTAEPGVVPFPTGPVPVQWARELAADALADLRRWAAALRARGYDVETRLVPGRGPQDGIVRVTEEIDADLIAITLRTHGLAGRLLVGSSARELLQRTARPVLICCEGAPAASGPEDLAGSERETAGAA
jgi:nucleotide-binding universal stress UspA family protein